MQKKSITNKITPCCNLPFSVMHWWLTNIPLNSEADREFLFSQLNQKGSITKDGWIVLINSGILELDSSMNKAQFLDIINCKGLPNCNELKLIIEGFKVGNYDPVNEFGVGWTESYILEEYNGKLIKKIIAYVGGVGVLPNELASRIGMYFGSEILTNNKDLAVDFRGQEGANGTAEIPDWVAGNYVEKSLVINNKTIWRVVNGQTAGNGDVPGASNKWVSLGGGSSFELLSSNVWNGENSTLNLNSNMNLILDTSKTYGILEIRKDFYSRNTLKINGRNIKMPFGNVLLSFVKIGNFYNFYVEKFSQTAKESSVNPQPIRNKIFTGSANDVVISTDAKFNLTQFSVSFSAKISANKFIAVSKGTTSSRNWDVIFTNLNTGSNVELQFNIGSTSILVAGNPLDSFINIVATFDGSVGKLYRNGTLLNTKNATLTAGGQLMIGEVLNLYSSGEISDLFITNKALHQTEVTEYNSSSDKSPLTKSFASSVVEYFSFGTSAGGGNLPEIQYTVPQFSIYPKPILMNSSRDWNDGDIANPDLTYDEKKLSGYNYILQYSAYGTTDLDLSPKWRTALAFSNDIENPNSWIVDKEFCFEPIVGEGYIAANGSIVIKDGWFYLFYQTGNSGDVNSSHIRSARSRDFKKWERLNGGNPVIQRTESYESAGAYDPMVRINESGLFEMVYCTYNGSQHAIGYATSVDGILWNNKKLVVGLNISGASEPCICKIGDRYLISVDLYNGSVRNIYGAFWDGINPIVSNTMTKMIDGVDDWNSVSCFDSYCFLKDESIYCFFAGGVTTSGTQGIEAQIGIAKANLIFS